MKAPRPITGFLTSQGLLFAQVRWRALVVSLPGPVTGSSAQDKLIQGLSAGAAKQA